MTVRDISQPPDPLPLALSEDDPIDDLAIEAVEPRTYIEIRPSQGRLDPNAVHRAMDHLLSFLQTNTSTGWLKRRRGTERHPVVEWLLVADGRPDTSIRYLVSVNFSDLIESLEGILRTCFPNTYEFGYVEWHPTFTDEFLPFVQPAGPKAEENRSATEPLHVAAVEYCGLPQRRKDWQTPLKVFSEYSTPTATSAAQPRSSPRGPLVALTEAMVDADCPVVYQVVMRPYPDWTSRSKKYILDIELADATIHQKINNFVFSVPRDHTPPPDDQQRIDAIYERGPARTFVLSARAVVLTREHRERANAVADRLATTLGTVSGKFHRIEPIVSTDLGSDGQGAAPGRRVFDELCAYTVYDPSYESRRSYLPGRSRASRGIVAGVDEIPGFCLIDGGGLPPGSRRAVSTRPFERTGMALPSPAILAHYAPPGQAVGMPLTHDRSPYGRAFYLQPSDQNRHTIVVGPTGSGKSILTETAALTNVEATAGPEIVLDLKGGGTSEEYLQMHFATYGHLDNVLYFDCTQVLPALSVLDIEPLLAAGIPREEARSRIAGHYEEMLATLMGADRFWEAVESPKVIRNHLRALFDPVNGLDTVSNANLFHALARTQRDASPPAVSDDRLADYFASLLDRDRDVFNRIVGGALNRVETIATDGRLAPMFDHVPRDTDPHFDFADVIDENRVIIFDFGGMEDSAKRAMTLALFSNLWRALQARSRGAAPAESVLLANLYIEEAGAIGDSTLLDTLLSQGRSFGLGVMLGVQFLGQLDSPDAESQSYEEALNETATIIAGQVAQRDDLVHALATDSMSPDDVDRRLSRLPRGEWLIRPGTGFGVDSVTPFLMESLPVPPGHPASDEPLSGADLAEFDAAFERVQEETAAEYGLDHGEIEPSARREEPESAESAGDPSVAGHRLDTAYPHSNRMPPTVDYDPEAHALVCLLCDNLYDPGIEGMKRAVSCHSSIDEVDRDDVPIGGFNVKRSAEERDSEPLTDRQFMFEQAVYDAMQGRWDPLEYDPRRDSMIRIQEYVGIDPDEVQELIDLGLLRLDTDHPHRLYSVTPAGRAMLGESYREGVDYGHGKGDLEESSPHIMGVQLGVDYLEQAFVDDPESAVVEVEDYYDIGGNRRLDAVGLDAEGTIVVTLEMERVNNDLRRAAPEDFDKMASCEPEEAIWIVMSHSEGHEIYDALCDPLDGVPRITKSYGEITPVSDFRIDEPGFTRMLTVGQLQRDLGL